MNKQRKFDKFLGKIGIIGMEEAAFSINLTYVPLLRKQQKKAIRKLHQHANNIRKIIGEKPRKYRRFP